MFTRSEIVRNTEAGNIPVWGPYVVEESIRT
jgi:hypothetical protein